MIGEYNVILNEEQVREKLRILYKMRDEHKQNCKQILTVCDILSGYECSIHMFETWLISRGLDARV